MIMLSAHVYNEIREKFTEETANSLISFLESKPATEMQLKDTELNVTKQITSVKTTLMWTLIALMLPIYGLIVSLFFVKHS